MKAGDRIAIKRYQPKNSRRLLGLAKADHPTMLIKAVGTITSASSDNKSISVKWRKLKRPREWRFYASPSEIWEIEEWGWRNKSLVEFAFDNSRQDIKRHRIEYEKRQKLKEVEPEDWYLGLPDSLSERLDSSLGPDWRLEFANRIGGDVSRLLNLYLDSWSVDFKEEHLELSEEDFDDDYLLPFIGLENRELFRPTGFEIYTCLDDFLESLTRVARSLKAATKPSVKRLSDQELEQLSRFDALTEAENVVLEYWCQAWSNPEIAKALKKQVGSVNDEGDSLREKIGARSKLEAVVLAYRLGWIDP
jgi:DNA-binding CsgD family transcriptional regulator